VSFPIIRTIDNMNVWSLDELPNKYERAIKHTSPKRYKTASNIILVGGILTGLVFATIVLLVGRNEGWTVIFLFGFMFAAIAAFVGLSINQVPTEYERIRSSLVNGMSAYTLSEDHPIYRAIMAPELVSRLRTTDFSDELSGVLHNYYMEAEQLLPHANPFDSDRVARAEKAFSRDTALLEKARSFRSDLTAAKLDIESIDRFWNDREKQLKATHENALNAAKQELERQLNAANRALG
jgi:hypothetical protein